MSDNNNNIEESTVTLSLDDGRDMECDIIAIFPAAGKDYIALLPRDCAESEEGEVFIYRYSESADGEPTLENIEDDDEYEVVADAFDQLLDEEEFDELDEEEDAE